MKTPTIIRRVGRPRRDAHEAAADTREVILIEAAKLFSQHGYRGVRLKQIAAAAGLSGPAVYYYFKDKEDILRALGVFSLGQTIYVTNTLIERRVAPGVALFLILWFHASRSMLNRYDMWYQLQFAGDVYEDEFFGDYVLWRNLLRGLINDGVLQGYFREIPEVVALNLIIGCIYGIKELHRTERIKDPEALAEFAIRGLAKNESGSSEICAEARRRMPEWQELIFGTA